MAKTRADHIEELAALFRDHQITVLIAAGASHELPYVTEDEGLTYPLGIDLARRIAIHFDSDLRQSRISLNAKSPSLDDVVNKLREAAGSSSDKMIEEIQLYVKELFD